MDKKYAVSVICAGVLMLAGSVGAVTNSDSVKTENAELKSSLETRDSQKCPEGQMVVGETNSIPPAVICGPKVESRDGEGDDSSNRVLPTVNKVESNSDDSRMEGSDDDGDDSAERLLPTVNKKTGAKVEVRGWDPDKKEAILEKIQTALENNPEIKSTEVSENDIAIRYSAPGKFLGLFPINFGMQVSSDAQARVKVKFPWYRFLLKTEFANTADLLNGIFQHNQTDLEFLKSKASEDRQVEIFITISNSLKIMHDMAKPIIGNIKA